MHGFHLLPDNNAAKPSRVKKFAVCAYITRAQTDVGLL